MVSCPASARDCRWPALKTGRRQPGTGTPAAVLCRRGALACGRCPGLNHGASQGPDSRRAVPARNRAGRMVSRNARTRLGADGIEIVFSGMRFVKAGISLALAVLFRGLLIVGAGGLGGSPSAAVWKGVPGTRSNAEADFSRVFPSTPSQGNPVDVCRTSSLRGRSLFTCLWICWQRIRRPLESFTTV